MRGVQPADDDDDLRARPGATTDGPATRVDRRWGGRWPGWFRTLYVACIVALSIQTLVATQGLTDHHTWLAGLEILGALLLLGRRVQRSGLIILLAVYAVAAILIIHAGYLPLYLVLYAGTAIFLVQRDEPGTTTRAGNS